MKRIRASILALLATGVTACGGSPDVSCDDVRLYQLAREGKRVETPEDLDDLEPLREIPLPRANPGDERPPGSPCLDLPPSILTIE